MKTTIIFFALSALAAFAQPTSTPQPLPFASPFDGLQITASPKGAATYQVGQTATVKFRAKLASGVTTSDFRNLPVTFNAIEHITNTGITGTTISNRCDIATGVCVVKVEKPMVVLLTALSRENGTFQQVVLNFTNMRGNFPATVDVTATMTQAQEGVSTSVIATSPLRLEGSVFVEAFSMFSNNPISRGFYFPNGLDYGQRIVLHSDVPSPLSFGDRQIFSVRIYQDRQLVAEGTGSSVGLAEYKNVEAMIDDNNDLSFTLEESFNPAVEYNVVLLRGDHFRVELSQLRGEVFAYGQGNKTKIMFNRGSLGENKYLLSNGFYTINVHALDKSSSSRWSNSRVDAFGINGTFLLR